MDFFWTLFPDVKQRTKTHFFSSEKASILSDIVFCFFLKIKAEEKLLETFFFFFDFEEEKKGSKNIKLRNQTKEKECPKKKKQTEQSEKKKPVECIFLEKETKNSSFHFST